MYLLAILCPPVAILSQGKIFQAIINIALCFCFWLPGAAHAVLVVADAKANRRNKETIRALAGPQAKGPPAKAPTSKAVRLIISLGMLGFAALALVGTMASRDPVTGIVLAAVFGGAACWSFPWALFRRTHWRDKRPTAKQLNYARDLGISVTRSMSRGAVSDLISLETGDGWDDDEDEDEDE